MNDPQTRTITKQDTARLWLCRVGLYRQMGDFLMILATDKWAAVGAFCGPLLEQLAAALEHLGDTKLGYFSRVVGDFFVRNSGNPADHCHRSGSNSLQNPRQSLSR